MPSAPDDWSSRSNAFAPSARAFRTTARLRSIPAGSPTIHPGTEAQFHRHNRCLHFPTYITKVGLRQIRRSGLIACRCARHRLNTFYSIKKINEGRTDGMHRGLESLYPLLVVRDRLAARVPRTRPLARGTRNGEHLSGH